MDHVRALLERHFPNSREEVRIGPLPISELVAQYGTPLFVYDATVLDYQWAALRNVLPPEFHIFYSVKANPCRAILKRFLAKGCGLEIASGGEFYQAVAAGCNPRQILFAGPGKTPDELELVIKHGIGELHIESPLEADRVSSIASRMSMKVRVALRINPCGEAQGGAMRMGGKATPFGVDEEQAIGLIDRLVSDPWMEFHGIHLFAGTQILDDTVLASQYRKGLEIAGRIVEHLGHPLRTVDFGGGLGIPYFAQENELNLDLVGHHLESLMREVRMDPHFTGTQFIVEPGRFLVGDSGLYVSRIIDIKVSRGKKFLILDGGMHHHLAASGNLGQVIKRNFPVAVLTKITESRTEIVDLVGPLCTPLDTLARDVMLPLANVGDLVGVFRSGAYARTSSPLGFLSHPTPPEVMVDGTTVSLVRRRGRAEDYAQDLVS